MAKIPVVCPCGSRFQAEPFLAGKSVNCPTCGESFDVPNPWVDADPIRVACECGQAFHAQPRLFGKQLECPSCGGSLDIPYPDARADDPLGLGEVSLAPLDDQVFAPPSGHANVGYGSVGYGNYSAGGYAPRKRARPKIRINFRAVLVSGILLLLIIVVSVCVSIVRATDIPLEMMLTAMVFGLGVILIIVGDIWVWVIAVWESPTYILLCIFIPFYPLIYVLMRWEDCYIPFFIFLSGVSLLFCAAGMASSLGL